MLLLYQRRIRCIEVLILSFRTHCVVVRVPGLLPTLSHGIEAVCSNFGDHPVTHALMQNNASGEISQW